MSPFERKSATAVLVIALAIVPAFAATGNSSATVGDFLRANAEIKGLESGDAAQAVAALRNAGYAIPDLALDRLLTQGDVVRISQSLGLNVTTSTPEATFGENELGNFFSAFGETLSGGTSAGGTTANSEPPDGKDDGPANPDPPSGVDPISKGKGKKKGLMKSPSEPER